MRRLLLTLVLVNVLVIVPLWLRPVPVEGAWLAADAMLITALLVLLPRRRLTRAAAWLGAALIGFAAVANLADAGVRWLVGRGLNLSLDLPSLHSFYILIRDNVHITAAFAAGAALLVLALFLLWVLRRRLEPGGLSSGARTVALATAGLGAVGSVAAGAAAAGLVPGTLGAATPVAAMLGEQSRLAVRTRAEGAALAERLADAPAEHPLPDLEGRDVIIGFVESYGVSSVFDARYGPVIQPRLADMAERLEGADLEVVSGTLAAPIIGGQSWLAHATTLSGEWIDNQHLYERLIAAEPPSLVSDFAATGHATAKVVPAITMDWPEGEAWGLDAIHAAADIDYRGPALNWVTMPDQFTWHYFEHAIRAPTDDPLFAQVTLISSHSPWTPVIDVIEPWSRIGDGRIFARFADQGPEPATLWRDLSRVRDAYASALDYSLDVSIGFAERHVDDDTLLILIGDHQPLPLVVGADLPPEVPVHVISGDAELLAPWRERGFVAGTLPPPPAGDGPGMDALRDWLQEDFGGNG